MPSQVGHLSPSAHAPNPMQVGHFIILKTAILKVYELYTCATVRFCSHQIAREGMDQSEAIPMVPLLGEAPFGAG